MIVAQTSNRDTIKRRIDLEVSGAAVAEYTPRMIGLTLAEGKHMLAAADHHCQFAFRCAPCSPRSSTACGRRFSPL